MHLSNLLHSGCRLVHSPAAQLLADTLHPASSSSQFKDSEMGLQSSKRPRVLSTLPNVGSLSLCGGEGEGFVGADVLQQTHKNK